MDNPLILPSIAAIIIFVVYMIIVQAGKQDSTRERLKRLVASGIVPKEENKDEYADPFNEDLGPSVRAEALARFMQFFQIDTEAYTKANYLKFYRAGFSSQSVPIYFLFFKRFGFLVFILFAYLFISKDAEGTQKLLNYFMAGLLVFLAILGPDMYLQNRTQKRQKILTRSFPDALDLLTVCVESGLALDGALARVCKELGSAHPEITVELNRTRLELTLLNDRSQALLNLSERTAAPAFRVLVSTMLQAERFGTSLAETLRVLSEDFRNSRLMMAEEKAGRIPALMTLPLISFMLPALFLIILGPAILSIMHIASGNP